MFDTSCAEICKIQAYSSDCRNFDKSGNSGMGPSKIPVSMVQRDVAEPSLYRHLPFSFHQGKSQM